jgi:anti-sigma factor RsiW
MERERSSLNDHIEDELLEAYALSRLQEPQLEYVEEHLLICEPCRARLVATDAFAAAMRAAARPRARFAWSGDSE